MTESVWLFGNADGDGTYDWSLDREIAFEKAAQRLVNEVDQRAYSPDDGWREETGVCVRRPPMGYGHTTLFTIVRRGKPKFDHAHRHSIEIYECPVLEEDGENLVVLVAGIGMTATITKVA